MQARIRPRPASAMRCIAATRFGNPLCGTWKSHGKRLEGSLSSRLQTFMGLFKNFLSRRNGGLPNPARRGKPRRGRGKAMAADGELVHQAADGAVPQAVADGSSPSRFPKFARSAQPRTLAYKIPFIGMNAPACGAAGPLCVKNHPHLFIMGLWNYGTEPLWNYGIVRHTFP